MGVPMRLEQAVEERADLVERQFRTRDYLTDDGALRPDASDRLERGETGRQRARALIG
jgi:hypothetical protein